MRDTFAWGGRELEKSLCDSINDGIVIIDFDYNIIDTNSAMLDIAGYEREEFVGKKCYEVLHEGEAPCQDVPCTIKEVLEMGEVKGLIHTHRRKDGSQWVSEISGAPLKDDQGNVRGVGGRQGHHRAQGGRGEAQGLRQRA